MFIRILFFFLLFGVSLDLRAAPGKGGGSRVPKFSVSGTADLNTHFIHRGLSYTDRDPSLNADFLIHMGSQFKFGIWGSNISQITNSDDNLWLKFVGEIRVDINPANKLEVYIHDHHFYTSQERNGQSLGFRIIGLDKYQTLLELGNNFEATHANYEYLQFTYFQPIFPEVKAAGSVGFTHHNAPGSESYFDFKAELIYQPLQSISGYLATTFPSNFDQFGERSKLFIVGGIRLQY